MDQLFELLKSKGGNNVSTIIDLLKQAHILDPLKKEMETRVLELLKGYPEDISKDKFKEIVTKVAEEQGKSVDEITEQMTSGTDTLNFDAPDSLDPSVAESPIGSGAGTPAGSGAGTPVASGAGTPAESDRD